MQANVATLPRKPRAPAPDLGLGAFKQVEAVVVDAVELVKTIHGLPYVDLSGFGQPHEMPMWTHPAVAHVTVADSPTEALNSLTADRRRTRLMVVFAGLVLAIAAASGGALFAYLKTARTGDEQSTLVWTPVDVADAGLVVATPAGRITIPLGGKLPNGDVLLSVQPGRRIAVLSSGALLLQPERKAKP